MPLHHTPKAGHYPFRPALERFPDELVLLVVCAGEPERHEEQAAIAALLERPIDWDYFEVLVEHHRIAPMIYPTLRDRFAAHVPEQVLAMLRKMCQHIAMYNTLLAGELVRLGRLFKAHDVPFFTVKGPMLAMAAYGTLAGRSSGDLDLVVPKKCMSAAKDLLCRHGYKLYPEGLDDARAKLFLAKHRSLDLLREDGQVFIELHEKLNYDWFSSPLDIDTLWEHLVSLPLAGEEIPTLPPVLNFVFLCEHGSRHAWKRLFWLCDINRLVKAEPALDWDTLLEQADGHATLPSLLLGAYLIQELFGTSLPETVTLRLQNIPRLKELAGSVQKHLLANYSSTEDKASLHAFGLALAQRRQDKLRYLWWAATIPALEDFHASTPGNLIWARLTTRRLGEVAGFGVRALQATFKRSSIK